MSEQGAFLLLGPEAGEKDAFIETIRTRIANKLGEQPEAHTFYPFEARLPELIALLRNGSLFSKHRIVVVRDAHEIKRKEEIDLLLSYLKQPSPDATLVLVSSEIQIDKRLAKAVPAGAQKVFWELFDNQKRAWVASFFSKAGLVITNDSLDLLLDMVENNTLELRRECERLVSFFGKGKTVDVEDIEGYIYHSKQENVFTLFDRIAAGSFEAALDVLRSIRLAGEGNAVQLLAGLLWQFRRLLAVKSLVSAQYSIQDACLKNNIRSKRSQRSYTDAVKNYSLVELRRIIVLIAHFDATFRSVRAEAEPLLLDLFLYYCVIRKGNSSPAYRA